MSAIREDTLRTFASDLLVELGAPDAVSRNVARSLVDADLTGHTSHGVLRIPSYGEMIQDRVLDPEATPTMERDRVNMATIDGNHAFGQVVGRFGTDVLVEKATQMGVAGIGIRNATHLGRMGEWAERATEEGLMFGSFVNTSGGGLIVAPAGSTTRRFSTNPLTFGVPPFGALPFPLVLDMASSQVAQGKLMEYEANERSVPGEWAVSADGTAMTEPGEVAAFREGQGNGAVRPLGGTTAGHKGTGLAVMAELFAGLLGGSDVVGQRDPESWFENGAFFFAVDPTAFGDPETMGKKVDTFVEHFRGAESHPDVPVGDGASGSEPLLPGEAEYRTAQVRKSDGIPLPERVLDELEELADELAVENPLP
ncbi:MAG: Ldh family oxidoreductase [Halodesulfurarchaeum sp.]